MKQEKRRYFRIDETIGLSLEILNSEVKNVEPDQLVDIWDLVSDQDEKIEKLLTEAAVESPKVAELIRAFNQKIERIAGQLVMESRMLDKLANRVKEVNISACGLGFLADRELTAGIRLQLELQLFPSSQKILTKGRVIACDEVDGGYYVRIDFFDMKQAAQEQLIQHIVQRQSAQLKVQRVP